MKQPNEDDKLISGADLGLGHKQAEPERYRLVLVEWIDTHSTPEWDSLDNLTEKCRPMQCKSVGWLVAKQNGATLLVPHIAKTPPYSADGSGSMAIPDVAIVSIKDLSGKE